MQTPRSQQQRFDLMTTRTEAGKFVHEPPGFDTITTQVKSGPKNDIDDSRFLKILVEKSPTHDGF